jgi:hypothetical protein
MPGQAEQDDDEEDVFPSRRRKRAVALQAMSKIKEQSDKGDSKADESDFELSANDLGDADADE